MGFLSTIGSISMLLGVMLYGMYLTKYEYRSLMLWNSVIAIPGAILSFLWLFRVTQPYLSDMAVLNI